MKFIRLAAILFLAAFLSHNHSAAYALDMEDVIEKSMQTSLVSAGLDEAASLRIAKEYMFMGAVMISKAQFAPIDEDEVLLAEVEKTASALGFALANAKIVYGNAKLPEIATAMMHSVRAGVDAEVAANTFASLANNGYAFDVSVYMLHAVSEMVRDLRSSDASEVLFALIEKLVAESASTGEMEKEMRLAFQSEKAKQAQILASKEAERRKRESAGGLSGGGSGRGSVASGSSGGSAGSDGASAASGSRGGSDDGSGGSGDDSSSGGSNDSDSSGGNSDDGSGDSGSGNDSSGGDGGGSGGDDSSGSDSDSSSDW